MTYEQLSGTMQTLVIFQYEMLVKIILFSLVIGLSLFYLFYYKKNVEKPTTLLGMGIVRIIFTTLSYISLILFPFGLIPMAPNFGANIFYSYYMLPYMIFLILLAILMLLNFLYFAPQIIFAMAGADIDNKKVKKLYLSLKKYSKKHE